MATASKKTTGPAKKKPGRPAGLDRPQRVSVLIEYDPHEQLRRHAFHMNARVSDVIRLAVADWLRRNPPKPV